MSVWMRRTPFFHRKLKSPALHQASTSSSCKPTLRRWQTDARVLPTWFILGTSRENSRPSEDSTIEEQTRKERTLGERFRTTNGPSWGRTSDQPGRVDNPHATLARFKLPLPE